MTTQDFVKQLLAHMGMENVGVDIEEADEAQVVHLLVDEQDSGLLIGRHAETIDGLQRVVRLVCQKDGDKPIHVNINDFRERREEHLRDLAQHIAERVVETGEPHSLQLPASERRIVHMVLADFPGVETESQGEGMHRVLFVKPKTNQA